MSWSTSSGRKPHARASCASLTCSSTNRWTAGWSASFWRASWRPCFLSTSSPSCSSSSTRARRACSDIHRNRAACTRGDRQTLLPPMQRGGGARGRPPRRWRTSRRQTLKHTPPCVSWLFSFKALYWHGRSIEDSSYHREAFGHVLTTTKDCRARAPSHRSFRLPCISDLMFRMTLCRYIRFDWFIWVCFVFGIGRLIISNVWRKSDRSNLCTLTLTSRTMREGLEAMYHYRFVALKLK